jgi:photosystem II stability/assembly factor-like uncharacterized protein
MRWLVALALAGVGVHSAARPPTNIDDVEFLNARVGFLTASTGQFDHEPARIQRTTDGGRTWHDVWARPRTHLGWIAFADARHGFVGGDGFILRTRDGGRTWTRARMVLPRRLKGQRLFLLRLDPTFVTLTIGFAVTDPASWSGPVFLRTSDGGVHWSHVRGTRDVYDVDFVSRRLGFAIGTSLYRTTDGGASWHKLHRPRAPFPLAAVDFVDARHGFVAGGWPAVTERRPSQVIFATSDGGRTWTRRFVNPHRGFSKQGGNPFARLRFVDGRRGWATTGLCKCCPSGPCAGDVLVTGDGGYTWRRHGTEMQISTIGARYAWALQPCDFECHVVLTTTDAGRTWRPLWRRK